MEKNPNEIKNKDKIKLLFVCLGNICRSPAAEGIMKSIINEKYDARFEIDSAGTGNYHIGELPDNRMRIHGRRRGYDFNHRCRQIKTSDFEDFDLIIAMDESNRRNLKKIAPTPEAENKIVMMADFIDKAFRYDHIPDPYYEGSEGFELVLDLLENGCRNLYEKLA